MYYKGGKDSKNIPEQSDYEPGACPRESMTQRVEGVRASLVSLRAVDEGCLS